MEKVLGQILSDLQNGKLSHAILLEGGSPEDRHELACSVAKALVCSAQAAPCDACSNCIKANADAHPDILLYSGGATVGSFKVDTVREIRRLASVLPNEAERKVFVLENTQAMAAGAQNALLKILEEPPYYVHFVLTCPSQSAMLDTVLSRVTVYTCPQEQNQADTADLEKARTVACSILKNVAVKKEWDVLKETAQFEKDKAFFALCCQEMRSLAELALVNKVADLPADETVEQISSLFPKSKLVCVIDVCANMLDSIQSNLNGNLLITLFCAQLLTDQYGRI